MDLKNHQTTGRILDILELLAANTETGLRFSDIAAELHIPKSSLQPLIGTLQNRRYIAFLPSEQRYHLGEQIFSVGNCYTKRSDIIEQIKEVATRLSIRTDVTCFFGILSGNEVLYLLRINCPGNIQIYATTGARVLAHSTALGKSLLADLNLKELKKLFPEGLQKVTENTITDFNKLYKQILEINACGLSYECEESSPYIRCIASPVRYKGKVIAALSMSFPVFTKKDSDIPYMERQLQATIQEVEAIIQKNPEKWTYVSLT